MTGAQFLQTLQLSDSLFPVGAFAYSDGLETGAATGGRIQDAASLAGWMHHYLDAVFVPCEGLALLKCMRAVRQGDWREIQSLDEELTALKPSSELRASSRSVGRRLIANYRSLAGGAAILDAAMKLTNCNAPIAYGIVFEHRSIDTRTALLTFGYTRLAGMISAGMRLMALGQQQGQLLLSRAMEDLPGAVERVVDLAEEPLRAFSPLLDIAQMNHRYVYSRLFRS